MTKTTIIGIDASRAARVNRTGTETYALEMIKALSKVASEQWRLRLYTPHAPQHTDWPDSSYVETRVIPFPRLWTHWRLAQELRAHPPDQLFVPAHVLPLNCPLPALVTVHDLGYKHYPQTHPLFERWYLNWTTRRHCQVAHHIIADSQATVDDLLHFYQADPEHITVVYLGRDEKLTPVTNPEIISKSKADYSIEGDYLLYLGTLHPRKNLVRLIEAFDMVLKTLPSADDALAESSDSLLSPPLKLVIAGKKGWLYEEIFTKAQELGLEQQVIFPGFINNQDKPALLSGALAYLFPSLYEGFGLPVLEAMACGTPVLTSLTSSLPEVAGDAALLVNPHQVEDIAKGIKTLITNNSLRRELTQQGFQQIRKFSWDKAAAQVFEIMANSQDNVG